MLDERLRMARLWVAPDASQTPEWLVIPEGQQSGCWRLLHNSTDPGRRSSVGSSKRYQPKSGAEANSKAQDYIFGALHRVYFYDAWRPDPVLDVPGSYRLRLVSWFMAATGPRRELLMTFYQWGQQMHPLLHADAPNDEV